MKLISFLILLVFLIAGCTQSSKSIQQQAIDLCEQICRINPVNAPLERVYASGPCLSDNNPDWTIDDWVCDVAHNPRQDVDNQPENQCQAFREGKASHFVEVDTSCNFIKAV
jgi:hypothetical protein